MPDPFRRVGEPAGKLDRFLENPIPFQVGKLEIQALRQAGRQVHSDLANVRRACRVYEFFDPQPIELLPLLTEITKHIAMELDFRREADNADAVREIFPEGDGVVVPRMYREWSSEKVLTGDSFTTVAEE